LKNIIKNILENYEQLDLPLTYRPEKRTEKEHRSIGNPFNYGWPSYFKGQYVLEPMLDKFVQWFLALNPRLKTDKWARPSVYAHWGIKHIISIWMIGNRKGMSYDVRKRRWCKFERNVVVPSSYGYFTRTTLWTTEDYQELFMYGTVKVVSQDELDSMVQEEFRRNNWNMLKSK